MDDSKIFESAHHFRTESERPIRIRTSKLRRALRCKTTKWQFCIFCLTGQLLYSETFTGLNLADALPITQLYFNLNLNWIPAETKKINMDWIKSNKSSLRHAGHMPHDHIKRLDGIHGYLLTPAFQSFFQCIEADLSYKLDSHTEHPVTAFTRQCHLQLNLTTYQSINFSRSLELYFYKSLQWQRHCITSKRNTCWRAHKG